ncbi:MAG TPA: tungsten formylmethanofuran dehydrogenase [Xanthobacteraceae bacterium]|nr:tungsten formylmethanofuran dehydrogenase [Xanthobacteraceae bacterium]
MHHAWIDGKPVALPTAIAAAARLIDASRHPLIAGLGTDIAGARAAVALAQRIGAAVDHMNADSLLRDLEVMRQAGVMLTTPNETRVRADTLLLVGAGLIEAWNELPQRLLGAMGEPDSVRGGERRIFWLCPGHHADAADKVAIIGGDCGELPALLAALRARVSGRPAAERHVCARALDELADALKAASFGVAVWSAAHLDALAIEMLCGIVNDLNATTRFSGLPLAPGDNAVGVQQVCGWMTGFPVRTGFGRSYPDHAPWRYSAARLVESGETDCVLWISAYRAAVPEWRRHPPTIALTPADAKFAKTPRVHIAVAGPGRDHDSVEHCAMIGTLVAVAATHRSEALSVADAIAAITAELSAEPLPC